MLLKTNCLHSKLGKELILPTDILDHMCGAKQISLIKQVSISPDEYFILHIIWLGDGEYIYGLQVASQNPDPISIWDF